MNAVAKQELKQVEAAPIAPATESTALISMIERAARDPAVDIDKMERLMKMHEAALARNAKASYSAALSAMQPELPVIVQKGQIKVGTEVRSTYAKWEDANDAIKPCLAKHGFAISFRTGQTDNKISVTGVLSHRDGHSEETTMLLPIDTSGSKNTVQAVGSSTSYGKRYTASALLNLTSRGEDDDAKTAAGGFVNEKQSTEIIDLLEATNADRAKFLRWAKVERVEDIPAAHFQSCVDAIKAASKKS